MSILLVVCLLVSCKHDEESLRQIIEDHLYISTEAARILDQDMFTSLDRPPDIPHIYSKLSAIKQTRSLTVALLMISVENNLQVTNLSERITPELVQSVLHSNVEKKVTTLIRPQDIVNITVEEERNGETVGTFDWVVPSLFKGRCRFIVEGRHLKYLGLLRKKPVHEYDCIHIVTPDGDFWQSRSWMVPEYFALVCGVSARVKDMDLAAQAKEIKKLLAKKSDISIVPLQGAKTVFVSSSHHQIRDTVVQELRDSKDWEIVRVDRSILPNIGGVHNLVRDLKKELTEGRQERTSSGK